MRRTLTVSIVALFALAMMAGPAAAHHLVVVPPGGGQGPGEDAWVGGGPLPQAAQGEGLIPGGPTGSYRQSPAHGGGLNTACQRLRAHGNAAVDIHGPGPTTCHHGP